MIHTIYTIYIYIYMHTHTTYAREALDACVKFASQYITDRFLPDKARRYDHDYEYIYIYIYNELFYHAIIIIVITIAIY